MSFYYFDSSAIVKGYTDETGTELVNSLLLPENSILMSAITGVEVAAALARKLRTNQISQQQYQLAYESFEHDYDNIYLKKDVDNMIIQLAMQLTQRHPLRGYDAVQLSSALVYKNHFEEEGLGNTVFVCADDNLNSAAEKEGLVVINPKD
jgi:predicted nucleic acid-binding protein